MAKRGISKEERDSLFARFLSQMRERKGAPMDKPTLAKIAQVMLEKEKLEPSEANQREAARPKPCLPSNEAISGDAPRVSFAGSTPAGSTNTNTLFVLGRNRAEAVSLWNESWGKNGSVPVFMSRTSVKTLPEYWRKDDSLALVGRWETREDLLSLNAFVNRCRASIGPWSLSVWSIKVARSEFRLASFLQRSPADVDLAQRCSDCGLPAFFHRVDRALGRDAQWLWTCIQAPQLAEMQDYPQERDLVSRLQEEARQVAEIDPTAGIQLLRRAAEVQAAIPMPPKWIRFSRHRTSMRYIG